MRAHCMLIHPTMTNTTHTAHRSVEAMGEGALVREGGGETESEEWKYAQKMSEKLLQQKMQL